jgi:hypothetical protein
LEEGLAPARQLTAPRKSQSDSPYQVQFESRGQRQLAAFFLAGDQENRASCTISFIKMMQPNQKQTERRQYLHTQANDKPYWIHPIPKQREHPSFPEAQTPGCSPSSREQEKEKPTNRFP